MVTTSTIWHAHLDSPFAGLPAHTIVQCTALVPQVDDWHDGLIKLENDAKDSAGTLLFVIDDMTRGVMSVAEAAYYLGAGRKVVLAIQKYPVDPESPAEGKDINRGRDFLRCVCVCVCALGWGCRGRWVLLTGG